MAKALPENFGDMPATQKAAALPENEISVVRLDNKTAQLEAIEEIMPIMATAFDPAYGEAWNRAQTQSMLAMPSTKLWLVYCNNTADNKHYDRNIIGFTITSGHFDEQEVMLIAVSPEWQSRGIGKTLLHTVFTDSRKIGISKIFLEMRHNNPASSFYYGIGFTKIGERKHYYRGDDGQKYDAITLMKNIY